MPMLCSRFGVSWLIHKLILLFPRLGKRGKLIPELFGPMHSKGTCGSGADVRSWSSVPAAFSTNKSEELQWERGRITLVFQGPVLAFFYFSAGVCWQPEWALGELWRALGQPWDKSGLMFGDGSIPAQGRRRGAHLRAAGSCWDSRDGESSGISSSGRAGHGKSSGISPVRREDGSEDPGQSQDWLDP